MASAVETSLLNKLFSPNNFYPLSIRWDIPLNPSNDDYGDFSTHVFFKNPGFSQWEGGWLKPVWKLTANGFLWGMGGGGLTRCGHWTISFCRLWTRVRRSYWVWSEYKRMFIRFEANKMVLFAFFGSKRISKFYMRNEFGPEPNFRFKRIFWSEM
jgi:hypothetical protein